MSLATSSTFARFCRPLTATLAPSSANAIAIALPMLRPDPVTSATFPSSFTPASIECLPTAQSHYGCGPPPAQGAAATETRRSFETVPVSSLSRCVYRSSIRHANGPGPCLPSATVPALRKPRIKGVSAMIDGGVFIASSIAPQFEKGPLDTQPFWHMTTGRSTRQGHQEGRWRPAQCYVLATAASALVRETLMTPLMPSKRVKRRLSWETPVV